MSDDTNLDIVKATSSRTNLDWGKTVKKLILNNIFIDHSVRFLTDFTINTIASSSCNTCCEQVRTLPSCWCQVGEWRTDGEEGTATA